MKKIEEKHNVEKIFSDTTLALMISRDNVLDEFFESIKEIDMPKEKIHLFAFVDTNDEDLVNKVKEKLEDFNFLSKRIFVTNEVSMGYEYRSPYREERIARNVKTILNDCLRQRIGTEFVFMLEDDTLVPPDSYKKLYTRMIENPKLAYITGVETSKTKDRHIGVAFLETDKNNEIVSKTVPSPKTYGIDKINSGGWYCWMGRPEFIVDQNFRSFIQTGIYLGPDTLMVYDLVKKGFDCECDWSIQCKHYDPNKNRWIEVNEAIGWKYTYKKIYSTEAELL
jgi:hypothetical protein